MPSRKRSESETANTSLRFLSFSILYKNKSLGVTKKLFYLEMNYQHLYAYLETRPIDELKECMINVVGLTKKHAAPMDQTFETEDSIIFNSDIVLKELHQLRVAQRILTQESISGKFGSVGVGECLTKPEVISHLANVNGIIDDRMYGTQKDVHSNVLSKSIYVPIFPHPSTVESEFGKSGETTKVPSRDNNIIINNIDAPHNAADSPELGKRKREHGTISWTPDMVCMLTYI